MSTPSYHDVTKDTMALNESLQSVANEGYITAFTRCAVLIPSLFGLDYALMKTKLGNSWTRYRTVKVDNKLYFLALVTVMLTQYSVKSVEMEGLSKHNHQLYESTLHEEMEQIKAMERKNLLTVKDDKKFGTQINPSGNNINFDMKVSNFDSKIQTSTFDKNVDINHQV
jgi:hypothetical protein